MKDIEKLVIKYVGYKDPSSEQEVEMEILGLRTAIAAAEQRIAALAQGLKLHKMMLNSQPGVDNEPVSKTTDPEKVK